MLLGYFVFLHFFTYAIMPSIFINWHTPAGADFDTIKWLCFGWMMITYVIYWGFIQSHIKILKKIKSANILYVCPMIVHVGININMIYLLKSYLDQYSYLLIFSSVIMLLSDMFLGFSGFQDWASEQYKYRFGRRKSHEVVRRFSYLKPTGRDFEHYGFFEFFAKCRPDPKAAEQHIFENKIFIQLHNLKDGSATYSILISPDLCGRDISRVERLPYDPKRCIYVRQEGSSTGIEYGIYGPIRIATIGGPYNEPTRLLFREGDHYDSFKAR